MAEGQDAISQAKVAPSMVPRIDFALIERGPIDQARVEMARALKLLQQAFNDYVSRKGL